jgi:hypothetical protein
MKMFLFETPPDVASRFEYAKKHAEEIKTLERVTVKSRTKRPVDLVNERYTTGFWSGTANITLDNINNPTTNLGLNALEYIRNRITQLELQGNGLANRKNFSTSTRQYWAVGIYLNEIPTDNNILRTIKVNDVALVKFFEAGFAGVGSSYPGGAVAVYTKKQADLEKKDERLNFVRYSGYSAAGDFVNPAYGNKDFKQPSTDNRATIYWNSDVFFDASTAKQRFTFFNNDAGKKLKLVIEGIDGNGRLIHIEKILE